MCLLSRERLIHSCRPGRWPEVIAALRGSTTTCDGPGARLARERRLRGSKRASLHAHAHTLVACYCEACSFHRVFLSERSGVMPACIR